jgi:hypothetical protein
MWFFHGDQQFFPVDCDIVVPEHGQLQNRCFVSFDITLHSFTGSTAVFKVLFDTPSVRNLNFQDLDYQTPDGVGDIRVFNIGSSSPSPSQNIGGFTDFRIRRIDMAFDVDANQWDIFVDGVLLYSDTITADTLNRIRLAQSTWVFGTVAPFASTHIENFVIRAGVPFPLDSDGDNVTNDVDACPMTDPGETVDANGCSVADLCPCGNDWIHHGAYVSCVTRTSRGFLADGIITDVRNGAIVAIAGMSICGI